MQARIPGFTAPVRYPSSDGKPMAESDVHRRLLNDVIERLIERYSSRTDVYVSGNLLVYYKAGDPRKVLAPDGFVVFGVENKMRPIFKTWRERAVPSVVFEFTSKSTKNEDLKKKFKIYRDVWKVEEYFLFDPLGEYLHPSLLGYRLAEEEFVPIRANDGKLNSDRLGITLEAEGERLKMRDLVTGKPLLTRAEAEAERQREKALKEAHRAEKSEAKAETARDRAEAERVRAEAAQAEVQRLLAELAALKKSKNS